MSEQGWSLHIRRIAAKEAEEALTVRAVPCAILASNADWTSFVLLNGVTWDIAQLAVSLQRTILQVWFDEDSAITFQIFACDGWNPEFHVPVDGSYDLGEQDERLVGELVRRELLSEELTQKLAPSGHREEWLQSHGLEKLFGLPSIYPMPYPCTEAHIKDLARDAKLVLPDGGGVAKQPSAPAVALAAPSTVTRNWSTADRAIVDLHFYYLTVLWNFNDWKVYNRYKKHLPPERRAEVGQLVNLMRSHAPEENVRQALEAILATIWDADDWDALIRDPALLTYEPLTPSERDEWQRLLLSTPSLSR